MSKFTADFETSTPKWLSIDGYSRVWAYAICEIGNTENFVYGNNIEDFFKWCFKDKRKNHTLYFHNLKFDGEYIFYYLLTHGYEVVQSKKEARDKTFTCLISDTGQFYSIEIYETAGKYPNKVTIYDSLKILNFSVDQIAKDFSLPIRKLELDYDTYRSVGHELTEHEIDYIKNDVTVMAMALDIMFKENLTKMTIGSDALSNFKSMLTSFDLYFPTLPFEIDKSIRDSYKGGFTYLNPIYKEADIKRDIIVVDSNSMHPSHMMNDWMPIGNPVYYQGKYEDDTLYPLFIQRMSCSFKLKEGKIPSIQLKHTLGYVPTEYLETTNGDIVTLTLTSVDYELFFMQYDVSDITYHDGFKFKRLKGIFTGYIEYWTNQKIEAKKNNNTALYRIAKLMLNSLYGKFGLNPRVRSKYPVLDNEDERVRYKLYPEEIRDSVYCPVASFITAYSRYDIITTSQAIRDYSLKTYGMDYWIYNDTDSVHMIKLTEEELSKIIKLDDYKLGYYKVESKAIRGLYIRQKCYLEVEYITEEEYNKLDDEGKKKWKKHENRLIYTKYNTTIAGLPSKPKKYVTPENFKKGFSIKASEEDKEHKLAFKHVKGGVLLVDTDFTIKE